jgi:hypothetical protein
MVDPLPRFPAYGRARVLPSRRGVPPAGRRELMTADTRPGSRAPVFARRSEGNGPAMSTRLRATKNAESIHLTHDLVETIDELAWSPPALREAMRETPHSWRAGVTPRLDHGEGGP